MVFRNVVLVYCDSAKHKIEIGLRSSVVNIIVNNSIRYANQKNGVPSCIIICYFTQNVLKLFLNKRVNILFIINL